MTHLYGILWAVILFTLPSVAGGQWEASAELDTNRIRIGEQPVLTVRIDYQERDKEVQMPPIEERLGEKIELIEKGTVDTIAPHEKEAPELRRMEQKIRITSFDSGFHAIPPLPFLVDGDTVRTEPLILEVKSVELGDNPQAKPIKGNYRFPYTWKAWVKDHWPWLAGGAALIALALILFLYFRKWRKGKASKPQGPPPRPPHERALEGLKELEEKEAFREWDPKSYYSELTGILRQYLEERYRIPALEETSASILKELAFTDIDEDGKGRIQKILRTADMAKFAKHRPGVPEREEALKESIAFVHNSVPLAMEEEGTEKNATEG